MSGNFSNQLSVISNQLPITDYRSPSTIFMRCLFFLVLLMTGYWLLITAVWAQVDLYPFPRIEEGAAKKERVKKPVDPFVQALSRKMEVPQKLLEDTMAKGMGRIEMIRLILISKKSGKALEELAALREKGTRLAKIAEEAGQDNRAIKKEAEKILKDLEKEVEKIKQELSAPATAVAGISEETLIKKSTGQLETERRGKNGKP